MKTKPTTMINSTSAS
ncbi:Protein of unknown function [Lactobacillus delbrueckii subsp. lactis]|nr:Protein of unknown function [Lactobacillus delbrueckii subsp. lactis]